MQEQKVFKTSWHLNNCSILLCFKSITVQVDIENDSILYLELGVNVIAFLPLCSLLLAFSGWQGSIITLAYSYILLHTLAYYGQVGWERKRWRWLVTRIYDTQLWAAHCLKMDHMLWRPNDYTVNAPHAAQLSGEWLLGNNNSLIIWDKHLLPFICNKPKQQTMAMVDCKQPSKSELGCCPRKSHRAAPHHARR